MLDVLSSALGVLVAAAWVAALGPRGGPANRARLALERHIADVLFGGPLRGRTLGAWLLLGALLAQIGLGLVFALPRVIVWLPSLGPALGYGAFQALWFGMVIFAFDRLTRSVRDELLASRTCPYCGAPEAWKGFDARGAAPCRYCCEMLHRGMWLAPLSPDSARLRRLLQGPAAVAICILGAGAGIFFVAIAAYSRSMQSQRLSTTALRTARAMHELPDDFILAIDLSLLLLALAALAWMYRRNLARWHDRQHVECRRCGYDLRAAPVTRGVGACPECGTSFARF